MRKVKAFLAALLLFVLTVGGFHVYISGNQDTHTGTLGAVTAEKKARIRSALTESLGENSYPIFGSSEFQHGVETPYHPANVFAQSDFSPVLIGAGYYQSLSHAVTLAAIRDSMKIDKAALILSPQWFRKTGVVDQAYASRFSETNYAAAMSNPELSEETKTYLSKRTKKLLKVDPKTRKRAKLYDNVLWKETGSATEVLRGTSWLSFLDEKEKFETMLLCKSREYRKNEKSRSSNEEAAEPDWTALLKLAEEEGEKENQNPFYINDSAYNRLEKHLPKKKDMNRDAKKAYQGGPEFEDLECFLKVCEELSVEPMLVLLPVNGYYYDYTGFPEEARQAYYDKIRTLAEQYSAKVADFSGEEYTKYFFEDRVHLGKKGWVMVDESLYQFYKED